MIEEFEAKRFTLLGMNRGQFDAQFDECLSNLKHEVLRAQKFFVSDDLVTFVDDNAMWVVGADMMRDGVLKMPFQSCLFEFEIVHEQWLGRQVVLVGQGEDELKFQTWGNINGEWVWYAGGVLCVPSCCGQGEKPGAFAVKAAFHETAVEPEKSMVADRLNYAILWTVGTLVSIRCDVTSEESVPGPRNLNAQRLAKGKLPLFEHKCLSVKPGVSLRDQAEATGTHASPRLHWRRGHVRRIGVDRVTFVRPCIVGQSSLGVISKDYRLEGHA